MQHLILWGTDNAGLMSVGTTVCKILKCQEDGHPLGKGHSLLHKMQITTRTEAAGAWSRSVFPNLCKIIQQVIFSSQCLRKIQSSRELNLFSCS